MHDRLARMRLFWCLYILDIDLSLRLQTPPLLSESELFVLEPRELSDDGLGLAVSLDGAQMLNLFTARQRLARVQGELYARLYTLVARHSRGRER